MLFIIGRKLLLVKDFSKIPFPALTYQILKNNPAFLSGTRSAMYKITVRNAETTEFKSVTPKLIANVTSAAGLPRIRIL